MHVIVSPSFFNREKLRKNNTGYITVEWEDCFTPIVPDWDSYSKQSFDKFTKTMKEIFDKFANTNLYRDMQQLWQSQITLNEFLSESGRYEHVFCNVCAACIINLNASRKYSDELIDDEEEAKDDTSIENEADESINPNPTEPPAQLDHKDSKTFCYDQTKSFINNTIEFMRQKGFDLKDFVKELVLNFFSYLII